MTSKSSKLKAHRLKQTGRPRKQGVPRYACGQIHKDYAREETEREAKSTAMEARERVHGLVRVDPKLVNQYGGYTAGRMMIDGKISLAQLEAGNQYAAAAYRHCLATGLPFPSARAQELGRVTGYSGEESETARQRAERSSKEMMRLVRILQSCEDGHQVKQTVNNLFIMDYEYMRSMHNDQLAWLIRGLNELIYQEGLRKNSKQLTVIA